MKQNFDQLENQFPSVFQSWHIMREIGRGSFGEVYEVQRDSIGYKETAAIKHISYPRDQYDLQRICSDLGTTDEGAVRDDIFQTVQEFRREYELMRKFSGQTHIVSCEDFQPVQKKDMPGYDIFIRMELLTPVSDLMLAGRLDGEEAVRLGIHICEALELLESEEVIHRDIKPENLFVNERGDYKLGDFGAARSLPGADATMSVKGTPAYMAPEIALQQQAGPWTDIYSLGLVMYRLLNNNQPPFVEAVQSVSTVIREQASSRRIGGEKIPAPANASPALAAVIMKACAYDPKDRYQTAAEFKKALTDACPDNGSIGRKAGGQKRESSIRNQNNIRVSVLTEEERKELERQEKEKREAEEARKQEEARRKEAEQQEKKKKTKIVIAACAALVLVISVVSFLLKQSADRKALYSKAQQLLQEEQFEEAEKIFTDLGSYNDAADKVTETKNSAKLKEGREKLADNKLLEAEKIFSDLGDFPGAKELLDKTQVLINEDKLLKEAAEKMQRARDQYAKGSSQSRKAASEAYDEAKKIYEKLAGKDQEAAAMVTECERWIKYIEAEDDLTAKRYDDAHYKFSELADAGFENAADRAAQVKREEKLDKADKLFADKKYDEARAAYSEVLDDQRGIDGLKKATDYWNFELADQKLNDEEYEAAAEAFEALGEFPGAQKAAKYARAQQALTEKRYGDALAGFTELKQYKKSEEMAKEALKWVNAQKTYEEAGALYANAEYGDAKEKYDSILFYEDAETLSEDCNRYVQLDKAREYMSNNRYSSALEILKTLEMDGLEDLIAQCEFGEFWTGINSEAGALLKSCYRYIYDQTGITANGKKNWAKQITPSSRDLTGAEIATKFATANQFTSKQMTNEERVKALYDALLNRLGREEDDYTREHGVYQDAQICVDYLNTGMTVTAVLDYIVRTGEYKRLCQIDGLPVGEITITESRDRDYGITRFVQDCYQYCLKRTADPGGLNTYTSFCLDQQISLERIMIILATSGEAESYYPDDRDYIRMLYRLMLGREAGDEEVEIHAGSLARGNSREFVAKTISESAECANHLDQYLLTEKQRGENRSVNGRYNQACTFMDAGDYEKARELFLSIPDYKDSKVRAEECRIQLFCVKAANGEAVNNRVHRCFETISQFEALDDATREAWAAGIARSGSTAEIIRSYVNYSAFSSGAVTDAERASAVWYILLGSRPDPENDDYKHYISSLEAGMSIGYEIFNLTKKGEYKDLCASEGFDSLEITSGEARDMSYPVTNLISTSYRQVLGRNGSAEEYNSWCVKYLSGGISVRELMVWFLYCPEAENAIPDKAEYIRIAFRYMLGREATQEEVDARMGNERKAIAQELTSWDEYSAHLASMGLK